MKLACRFGWHTWTKWTVLREGTYTKRLIVPSAIQISDPIIKEELKAGFGSMFKEQQRECQACGQLELRTTLA